MVLDCWLVCCSSHRNYSRLNASCLVAAQQGLPWPFFLLKSCPVMLLLLLSLLYSKLVYATALIREQGCLFIATNLDHADAISSAGSNGNSSVGRVMPGTGSLVAALQVASGVQPVSKQLPTLYFGLSQFLLELFWSLTVCFAHSSTVFVVSVFPKWAASFNQLHVCTPTSSRTQVM